MSDMDTASVDTGDRDTRLAERIADRAGELGLTVATAESLTSGAIASALGAAPKASEWFRGGVVAYASEVKHDLLAVPPGPVVSGAAACAMARGARRVLKADAAIAVTGSGGPDPQDGQPPGTVWMSVIVNGSEKTVPRFFPGDPVEVVAATVASALEMLAEALDGADHRADRADA